MNEFRRKLAVANLSWCFVEELRAHSEEEKMHAAQRITNLSEGLSEEDVKGAREWSHAYRDMERAFWAKVAAAAQ